MSAALTINRGMPTRPIEGEGEKPEAFNGWALANNYFEARLKHEEAKARYRETCDAREKAHSEVNLASFNVIQAEAKLRDSMRLSEFSSFTFDFGWQKHTVAYISDRIHVLTVGYSHNLADPNSVLDNPAPVAAHAATDDVEFTPKEIAGMALLSAIEDDAAEFAELPDDSALARLVKP